jgi:nitrogen fixation NifU-like protein
MMSEATRLKDLYRHTVLEHSRNPHHFGELESADYSATGHNPLCGDKCTVYLQVDRQAITDVAFAGAGCAICMASASIMTDAVHGQSLTEAQRCADRVLAAFNGSHPAAVDALTGDMAALGGVRAFPTRVRCATLPWKALRAALLDLPDTVTTESSD